MFLIPSPIRRALCGLTVFAAVTSTLLAQTESSMAGCGTARMARLSAGTLLENTRLQNPKLYARMMSGERTAPRRLLSAPADGIEYTFFVQRGSQYVEVTARLELEGAYALVWVDVEDTGKVRVKQALPALKRALDTAVAGTQMNIPPRDPAKGILRNDIDVFGTVPPDPTWEDKTSFLLTNLDPGILGYFSGVDQTQESWSNHMNLLYIDTDPGLQSMTVLLSTIAHEFQHLIHFQRYPSTGHESHRFFNEGLSENANLINGYYDRQNRAYLQNTNVDFFALRGDNPFDLDVDYQRAMTFVHYLREQFGERFIYEFAGTRGNGFDRLSAALAAFGISLTAADVMKGFAVANLLQIDSNPAFSYLLRLSANSDPASQNSPGRARPHYSFSGSAFPTTQNIVLEAGGIAYAQFTTPGALRVSFTGGSDTRFTMVAARNGGTEVVDLEQGTSYTLPLWEGGAYERVTFIAMNLAGGLREVQWNIEAITTGVPAVPPTASELAITGLFVDGAAERAVVYCASGAGAAALEVVNTRGEVLAHRLTDVWTPGEHSLPIDFADLPVGTYLMRLRQGDRAVSRLLFVTR